MFAQEVKFIHSSSDSFNKNFSSRKKCGESYVFWDLITYLLTQTAESFLRSCQLRSYWRISQQFMEPEGSSPCSQEGLLWTRSLSWARSIQSIPPHPISLTSILILSTHLRLGLPSGLFPSGFTDILYVCTDTTASLGGRAVSVDPRFVLWWAPEWNSREDKYEATFVQVPNFSTEQQPDFVHRVYSQKSAIISLYSAKWL
jgi:hypothetical protein